MSAATSFDGPRAGGLARWLQVLLVASLSINLLIAGAVLGGAWVARHHLGGGGPMGRVGPAMAMLGPVGKFVGTLKPERRAELRDAIGQHQTAMAEFNAAMASVRNEAAEAIGQTPFNRAKFEAVLKRLYETEGSARSAGVASSGAFVEKLTGEERGAFVRILNWPGIRGTGLTAGAAADTKAP